MRVLLVSGSRPLAGALLAGLAAGGHAAEVARDAGEGHRRAWAAAHDVILLDGALPGEAALDLLRRWRRAGLGAHVLALAASERAEERVAWLNQGADDCVARPV